MPQSKERKKKYMKEYMQKKRESQKPEPKPVETNQYSDNLPSESIAKPVETDCQKFRRIMTSPKRNPDDRFWANAHACKCDGCARWNAHEKKDSEWEVIGANAWGSETPFEDNEQKQLENTLKREGFDYKRSSNVSENPLGAEGSRELERSFFDDKPQVRDEKLDEWKQEDEAIRQKMREDYQKRECKKYGTEEKPEPEQQQSEIENQTDNTKEESVKNGN